MAEVRCPVVVGRDEELAFLERRLTETREGAGGLVLLVGEAGIGKSRLTREAEASAREAGMRVLRGRAVPDPVPFRSLVEAFQGALRAEGPPEAPELRAYRGALARLIPEWGDEAEPSEASPIMLQEAVLRLAVALAGARGLLLVLEDLHWADADTLAVVDYLADHLREEPVLCLGTLRPEEPGVRVAEAIAARRTGERLLLSRLTAEQIDAMVQACLAGHEVADPPAEVIRARAEGVPFVIEEMLSAYVAAGADEEAWATAPPATFRELVRARLFSLDEEPRRVVFAAAVLGRSFDWSLLAAVTGLPEDGVLAGLRAGVEAQLVEAAGAGPQTTFGFRHALVREALVAELLPPERAALALRAAEQIEARFPGLPGEWCERAAQLREEGGDALGAARLLQEAGRRALSRAALATAEAILGRARELAAEDPWFQMGIDERLLEVLALAGRSERLREVGEGLFAFWADGARETFARQVPRRIAPLHLRLARGLAAAGDWAAARSHLERAGELARRGRGEEGFYWFHDEGLLGRVAALGAHVALSEGEVETATRLAAEAEAEASRLGLREIACEALEARGRAALARGDLAEARAAFEGEEKEAGEDLPLWRARALLGLGTTDGCIAPDPARLLEAWELVVGTEAISTQVRIEIELGRTLTARLELAEAEERLGAAVERCRRFRLPLLANALAGLAGALALGGGSEEESAEALAATDDGVVAADAWAARGVASLVRGDRDRAIEQLGTAVEHALGARSGELRSFPGLWALLVGGETRSRVEASPHAAHRATAGHLAAAAAVALADGDAADSLLKQAEADLRAYSWDRHVALLLLAEATARDGWGDPAGWAREALAFFEVRGHGRLADACKRVLREVGAPVPRRGRGESEVPADLRSLGVTSREMDVLALVAEGLTNAQIAERLFVSPRTVESHVTSLLRKTQMESREGLAALVPGSR